MKLTFTTHLSSLHLLTGFESLLINDHSITLRSVWSPLCYLRFEPSGHNIWGLEPSLFPTFSLFKKILYVVP